MPDFSGIGAFGQGALQGYNQGLSNYAQLDQLARQREAERRAEQARALQSLLHGTQLAQTAPDVAERAMSNPRYGLNPEEIGPGVAASREMMQAEARLNAAIQSGDLSGVLDDPMVGKVIAGKPKEYLGAIKDITSRKRVDAILNGPGTPQDKARMLMSAGVNIPQGLLETGYPELAGAKAEATAGGTARGQLPYAGPTARAKAAGAAEGALPYAGPTAQARRQGEIKAELGPDVGASVPTGGTNVGRIARERETQADRARKLRGPSGTEIGPKDISAALNRVNTAARNDVTAQLKHVGKEAWIDLSMQEQQQVLDYLTNQRARALAANDPVAQGKIPDMPRPDAMNKFEQRAESGGWGDWIKSIFSFNSGESSSVPAPRTLRTPGPAAPAQGGWGKAEVVR